MLSGAGANRASAMANVIGFCRAIRENALGCRVFAARGPTPQPTSERGDNLEFWELGSGPVL